MQRADRRGAEPTANARILILASVPTLSAPLFFGIKTPVFAYIKREKEDVTDESLIDSYIYEIIALQKKYEYFLRAAKKMGLTNGVQRRAI